MSGLERSLRRIRLRPARALHLARDGTIYLGRRFEIHRSTDDGASWSRVCTIPRGVGQRLAQASRLASRMLRQEVRTMTVLADGAIVAANRAGVYHATPGEAVMSMSRIDAGSQQASGPMVLTTGPGGSVIWGEYISANAHGLPVRLFVSRDAGSSFEVAYTFAAGQVRHVHSVLFDESYACYWVLTGDTDAESGIGRLSLDFRDFSWLARGAQRFRAVDAISLGDTLVYGTDSGHEQNAVMRIDKRTGEWELGQTIDSCCIYCCRCGEYLVLSTSVNHAPANRVERAAVWVSRDGERWTRALRTPKDRWHPKLFQYGSWVLPRGASERNHLLLSGQALRGADGWAYACELDDVLNNTGDGFF